MKRIGRRGGFIVGAIIGILGALLSTAAVFQESFWLLCLGTVVLGMYNGGAQYYRFAAADASPPDFKSKAISLVLAGGLVGGLVGPELSKHTVDLFSVRYAGAYLVLTVFHVLAIMVLSALRIPDPGAEERHGAGQGAPSLLEQDAGGDVGRAAALEQADRLVQISHHADMDLDGLLTPTRERVIGAPEDGERYFRPFSPPPPHRAPGVAQDAPVAPEYAAGRERLVWIPDIEAVERRPAPADGPWPRKVGGSCLDDARGGSPRRPVAVVEAAGRAFVSEGAHSPY